MTTLVVNGVVVLPTGPTLYPPCLSGAADWAASPGVAVPLRAAALVCRGGRWGPRRVQAPPPRRPAAGWREALPALPPLRGEPAPPERLSCVWRGCRGGGGGFPRLLGGGAPRRGRPLGLGDGLAVGGTT